MLKYLVSNEDDQVSIFKSQYYNKENNNGNNAKRQFNKSQSMGS